ncbi:vacuolar protein 8 [Linderina pennispora]|uniref:Vacuolar protein 8 n=1 Tax=Linderina pennispora TaxID=61395 RepID=A0A1Y1WE29_9FUNG|nr:vacuolar protein 8 [Linderina pennispora]ORX71434.1 vacuolar protein 8 [Linderina pennispora]
MLVDLFEHRSTVSFYDGEPLQALSTLAYSDIYHLQLSAATAFSEISEIDARPVSRETMEPILYLLQSPHIDVQHGASAALGNLAVCLENKLLIVKMGGLEPLIRQMLSPNVDAQINSVGCITNLATAEENKMKIAKSGALIPLTRLAKSRDIRVQRNATGALLNMTHSAEHRQQLINAGAVPVLVSLLDSDDVELQYYATTALSNIAVDASGRRRLWDSEPTLVDALIRFIDTSTIKVQCQAVLTLRNLASDEEYQIQIVEKGGLESLLPLLQSAYVPLVVSASACLRNISIHPANEEPIVSAGYLPCLVNLITQSDNREAQCHVISALRNLVANSESDMESIAELGVFDHIKPIISDENTDEVVLVEMTAALSVFAQNDSLRPYMFAGKYLELLLPFTHHDSYDIQYSACVAISGLAHKCYEDSDYFVRAWDRPDGGLQSYLASFLALDDSSLDVSLRSIAVWTVLILLEVGSPELTQLITGHPSIIKNIEAIAEASTLANGDERGEYDVGPGYRGSRALDGDASSIDFLGDEEEYDRIDALAQQVIALVHEIEY